MVRVASSRREALRALLEHPATSDVERENAASRLAEMDQGSVSKAAKMPASMADMAKRVQRRGLATFKSRVRGVSATRNRIRNEWPSSWPGPREEIKEFERGEFEGGEVVIGWKCPDCNEHVSRVITDRMMFRLRGRIGSMEAYIKHILGPEISHLCSDCWDKWNNR